MPEYSRIGGFTAGLFLLAIVLFNPPILLIFDHARLLAGIPLLYLYLFSAWLLIIFLAAWIIEFHVRGNRIEENAAGTDVADLEINRVE